MSTSSPTPYRPTPGTDAHRLRSLLASGKLLHPYLSSKYFENDDDASINANVVAGSPPPPPATVETTEGKDHPSFFVCDNFVDLAASLALCCGASPPRHGKEEEEANDDDDADSRREKAMQENIHRRRLRLAADIGRGCLASNDVTSVVADNRNEAVDHNHNREGRTNATYERQHIVLILCDGMGNSILQSTLGHDDGEKDSTISSSTSSQSFFLRNNQPTRLRAVFPSTTPAALTTLATAAWPGRHGMPGWNLRDKHGCDFPGMMEQEDERARTAAQPPVQLLVLSDRIRDARSGKLASEIGFGTWDKVFVEPPWARKLQEKRSQSEEEPQKAKNATTGRRRMIYINAYNGDDYQNWSQGQNGDDTSNAQRGKRKYSDGTDFSAWFIGDDSSSATLQNTHQSTLFETAKIEETSFDTLGKPEGSTSAIDYFRNGINVALDSIARAEKRGDSTFTYLYTAHPDKHMHALGVEHEEVRKVVRGIETEVERLWTVLGDREALLSGVYDGIRPTCSGESKEVGKPSGVDAAVVVTADHGHVTVHEDDMIELPTDVLDLLEYACIGVHGKGRHGYLHCRTGLQSQFRQRWQTHPELTEHFLLLTIEEAIHNGLFGPNGVRIEVRPRLGDFVAISLGKETLVTPSEGERYKRACKCQGAHGSLLPEEMSIPFILLQPNLEI
mmetsp:Transcript_36809/g.77707  ORF Transcript_36809/g.77707 Transcript_36809/m.77707 type:complete len:676 (+) Transcript_36809:116-2143(+)